MGNRTESNRDAFAGSRYAIGGGRRSNPDGLELEVQTAELEPLDAQSSPINPAPSREAIPERFGAVRPPLSIRRPHQAEASDDEPTFEIVSSKEWDLGALDVDVSPDPWGEDPTAIRTVEPRSRDSADRFSLVDEADFVDQEQRVSAIDFDRVMTKSQAPSLAPAPLRLSIPPPSVHPDAPGHPKHVLWLGLLTVLLLGGAFWLGRRGANERTASLSVPTLATEPSPSPSRPEPTATAGTDTALTPTAAPTAQASSPRTARPAVTRPRIAPSAMAEAPPAMTAVITQTEAPTPPATTPTPAEEVDEADLPLVPTQDQVLRSLFAVRPAVQACVGQERATIHVRVTVANTGRVTTAVVQDAYWQRQPYGGCIANALRTAEFPEFRQARIVVNFPYNL